MVPVEAVRLSDVWVELEGRVVLEDVDLTIREGEFLGIIGPNGGGKTTLLKVILGLIKPIRGEVKVFGLPPQQGRRYLGYVPQYGTFDRDFPIKVLEVVLMGRLGKGGSLRGFSDEDRLRALKALELVEMDHLKDRGIGTLSGGELQRVLIARALVAEPRLLLLDEPTANVDVPVEREFFDLLEHLKERMAIVLVTHDVGVLSAHVEKIACLNRRLYYHDSREIRPEDLEAVYGCPVDLIAHGVPHRVLREHP